MILEISILKLVKNILFIVTFRHFTYYMIHNFKFTTITIKVY